MNSSGWGWWLTSFLEAEGSPGVRGRSASPEAGVAADQGGVGVGAEI